MGMTQAVGRIFKSAWSHGEEDDFEPEEIEEQPAGEHSSSSGHGSGGYRADKYASASYSPSYGGNGSSYSSRRLRPVAAPLRAREKNIYTLKPTNLDEASLAADYLKTGSAVVLNLESVDRVNAVRIIDFMSGVCYGLEGQGHAMKLGETIFLFTPADFEISSDETDYGENRDFFFKDMAGSSANHGATAISAGAAAQAVVTGAMPSNAKVIPPPAGYPSSSDIRVW